MTEPPETAPLEPRGLEVPTRRWLRWLWLPAGAVLAGLLAWWMTHPAELEAGGPDLEAVTKVDRPVYAGLDIQSEPEGRQLSIRKVSVGTDGDGVSVEVLLCHGGSIGATADPEPFCDSLEDAEGASLNLPEDQLVVSVTADTAQQVMIEEVEVSYREGLQWGTQSAGPRIVVDVRG